MTNSTIVPALIGKVLCLIFVLFFALSFTRSCALGKGIERADCRRPALHAHRLACFLIFKTG
jgi:hypothetical protein